MKKEGTEIIIRLAAGAVGMAVGAVVGAATIVKIVAEVGETEIEIKNLEKELEEKNEYIKKLEKGQ